MMNEPILDVEDIQGHVLPGFGTRSLRMLGFKINNIAEFKDAIAPWLENITSTRIANEKKIARSQSLRRYGRRPDDPDVLMALGFSSIGLYKLEIDLDELKDRPFKRGMHVDAPSLNDPYDKSQRKPKDWLYGDTIETTPDIIVFCGCEIEANLSSYCNRLIDSLSNSARLIVNQSGDRPDDDKEHFGFKDGVSQPAFRGRIEENKYLYNRYIAPEDALFDFHAKPGQPLVWPGQVVFGYPGQTSDPGIPGKTRNPGVSWMKNGSYLVVRRLRQDVNQFYDTVSTESKRLEIEQGINIDPELLMAKLVGRWKDGTPLVASPDNADPSISNDRMRINHFNFNSNAEATLLSNGEKKPQVEGDFNELKCPRMSHIRKINPRDGSTAIGTELTLSKLIARRGINFGKRYEDEPADERGLLFMCYQTSISNQFIFLQKNWANTNHRPTTAGHDMIIGQSSNQANQRRGSFKYANSTCPISLNGNWVKMTGGGYFAVPGIRGVKELLKN